MMKANHRNLCAVRENDTLVTKNERAITLIALVVTIIVLIILASIGINLIINSELFTKGKEARTNYQVAANMEQAEMSKIDELHGEIQLATEGTVTLNMETLNQIIDARIRNIYPVGSYYLTQDANLNPADLLGGEWTRVEDKIIVAAGSTYTAGSTGGNGTISYTPSGTNSGGAVQNHTLTVNEMPSHNHGSRSLTGSVQGSIQVGRQPGNPQFFQSASGIFSTTDINSHHITITNNIQAVLASGAMQLNINATHTHDSNGGGQAHGHGFTQPSFTGNAATLQTMDSLPRETMYVWKRTA